MLNDPFIDGFQHVYAIGMPVMSGWPPESWLVGFFDLMIFRGWEKVDQWIYPIDNSYIMMICFIVYVNVDQHLMIKGIL